MEHKQAKELYDLAAWLSVKDASGIRAVIGFDGYVDEVVYVVDKRFDALNYTRVTTLKEYGNRIAASSGLSSNVEIVSVSKKLGGNGPILANALVQFGTRLSYVGALGYPDIHPVFHDMAGRCVSVHSISNPSSTDAMEFEDGKIIRSKLTPFLELTFEAVKQKVGLEQLARLIDECSLIGFENWSMAPYSEQIWKGIYDEALPLLKNETKSKVLFFDIADPAIRPVEDLRSAMETISRFSEAFRVILGLNLREAVQVANAFGGSFECSGYDLQKIAEYIKRFVNTDTLVVHPLGESCCMTADGFFQRSGPYCSKPTLTTGAGDNFNAGFLLGLCLGAEPAKALLLGMAASGFYVRNARSADFKEIVQFLISWADGNID